MAEEKKGMFDLKVDLEHELVKQVIVLDKDKDGQVALTEFGLLIRSLNKVTKTKQPAMKVVEQCKKMFEEYDDDGNGVITYDEAYASWRDYMHEYCTSRKMPLAEQISFLAKITALLPKGDQASTNEILRRHEFRRQFHILDKDGNMCLGSDEYLNLLLAYNHLLELGKTEQQLKRDVLRMMTQMDRDSDGGIDLEEAYRQFKQDIIGVPNDVVMKVMRDANDFLADNSRYCPKHKAGANGKRKAGAAKCKTCKQLTARILNSNDKGMFEFLKPKPPSKDDRMKAEKMCANFAKMDLDGDGKLTKTEIETALLRDGVDDFTVNRYLKRLFAGDVDGDGQISLEEFKAVSMNTPFPKPSPINGSNINFAQLKERFLKADVDGDGKITPKELRTLLQSNGASVNEAREMATDFFRVHDKNNTNALPFEAFKREYVRMATFRVIYTLKCLLEAGVQLDDDVDGQLSREELFKAFAKEFGEAAASEQVEVCFNQMDTDQSGYVTLEELYCWYQEKTSEVKAQQKAADGEKKKKKKKKKKGNKSARKEKAEK